jgi:hypothetical protein
MRLDDIFSLINLVGGVMGYRIATLSRPDNGNVIKQ